MVFTFGQLGSQCGGFAARFDGGCNKRCADGFEYRSICGHPWNWCLRVHGAHDSSVVIGMGYGNAWWCLHPWNSLCVANIVRGKGFFKIVKICLYITLCCANDTL
jgi:hypothetical protein